MFDEREILKGIIDLHVHAGPSVANRAVDAADMLKEAIVAGYRGFLVKDHYFPSCMGVKMVQEHCDSQGVEIYSSMALNNSMGLFNALALDAAINMGAKIIYFPTVSSKNHIDHHKGTFVGSGKMSVPESPVVYVDENGVMDPAAVECLKLIAEKDVILGTGHGTAWGNRPSGGKGGGAGRQAHPGQPSPVPHRRHLRADDQVGQKGRLH